MRLDRLFCVFTFCLCLNNSTGLWAGFFIDSFITPQSVGVDGVNKGSEGGKLTGAGIFGDGRGYSLQTLNVAESMTATGSSLVLSVNPYNNPFEGRFQLNYIDPVPSESMAAAMGVRIADVNSNADWNVTIKLTGTPGTATYSTVIAANTTGELFIPSALFSSPLQSLGNLSEVELVFLTSSGVLPQLTLGPISVTAVPEPASWLLGSLAVSGVILRRRKLARRRS